MISHQVCGLARWRHKGKTKEIMQPQYQSRRWVHPYKPEIQISRGQHHRCIQEDAEPHHGSSKGTKGTSHTCVQREWREESLLRGHEMKIKLMKSAEEWMGQWMVLIRVNVYCWWLQGQDSREIWSEEPRFWSLLESDGVRIDSYVDKMDFPHRRLDNWFLFFQLILMWGSFEE
jgi:hypothetical protein